MKCSNLFAIIFLVFSNLTYSSDCDVPLDKLTFDGAYGYWNKDLKGQGTVVVFDKIDSNSYRVQGVYKLDSESTYKSSKITSLNTPLMPESVKLKRFDGLNLKEANMVVGLCLLVTRVLEEPKQA